MELNLDGKRVLVTGGSNGIGKAIVRSLRQEGANVYNYDLETGVDLMDEQVLNEMTKFMNQFDILINNVGGCGTCDLPDWRVALEKNYGIMLKLTEAFLMKRDSGKVITIASIYGKEKGPNPYFTSAKAAQIAYMKSQAGKFPNITFNTISPGHIDVGKDFPDKPKIIGKPEDVANIVTFLCSQTANHINGANIPVDGGASHGY